MVYDPIDKALPPMSKSKKWQTTTSVVLLAVVGFCGWSVGGLSYFGIPGMALANDVDRKITEAVQGIKTEQTEQGKKLDEAARTLLDIRLEGYEAKILDFKTKACKSQKDETAQVWRSLVAEYQSRYQRLSGRTYTPPLCSEL